MKILYYDCFAGISGDMNLGALIDLGIDKDFLIKELKKLPISNEFDIKIQKNQKMGITGTKLDVILKSDNNYSHDYNHEHRKTFGHKHRNLESIYNIIDSSPYNNNIKKLSKEIFLTIAQAEGKVHGKDIYSVHFHEVGAIDSIVDVIGAAICIDKLNVDRILASTVELGSGFVRCEHGLIPVPAPATVEILKGVPIHIGKVPYETTTPTGAAIIKTFVNEFNDKHKFNILKVGYGLGTKDFTIPNVLRVFLGETTNLDRREQVVIQVNIDDMSSELYSNIEEKLFENGALDVYKTPIIMKKGRPAILLSILTEADYIQTIEEIVFKETTTLGLRKYNVEKVMLEREFENISTKYGEITIKKGKWNGEVIKWKPEYESCKKVADENDVPIGEIYQEINKIIATSY